MNLREAISIVGHGEFFTLEDIDSGDLVDALLDREREDFGGWLQRALDTAGPDNPGFLAMVDDEIAKAKSKLLAFTSQSKMTLWRGLRTVPRTPVGTHWSQSVVVAKEYGSYIMRIDDARDSIDWIATLIRRISWPTEQEISLIKGSKVIVDVSFEGNNIKSGLTCLT